MEEGRYDEHPQKQDLYHEDEMIDTLSLSDLMIYDNNVDAQDYYRFDDQNPNLDIDDEFEFSSELLRTHVSNNVVFCGKIIPYKEPSVSQNTHKLESKKQEKQHKQRWRFPMFFKKPIRKSKGSIDLEKLDLNNYDHVPIRRVSILASATKPRWYLLMFGVGSSRFPAEMHIRDLKKRQISLMGMKDGRDKKISGGTGRSWSLMRFLGCGGGEGDHGHHLNAIVKIK